MVEAVGAVKDAVRRAWDAFSEPLEGRVYHLYADSRGLLTTGVGNLVDDLPSVLALPWKRPDGSAATRDEVVAAYAAVRSHAQEDAAKGGGWFARYTTIRLSPEDVDHLVDRRLASDEVLIRRRWPDYDDWPADAQLAIHSWAWAVGPGSPYPLMSAALRRGDFDQAAEQCTINPQRGTIVERNRRNVVLFRNAERVRNFQLEPDVVYWPTDLRAVVQAAPTEREIRLDDPALEDDGGLSRRDATSDAVDEAANDSLVKERS